MKKIIGVVWACFISFMPIVGHATENVAVQAGTVTMLDLGSENCLPCKMMVPILARLKIRYEGRAEILFIDVVKERKKAKKYNVKLIPTQIFYTQKGEEIYRHEGFISEDSAEKMLDILLEE